MNAKDICSVCAWREPCNKKFSVSGRDIRCPEFVEDVRMKEGEKKGAKEKKKEG